MTKLVDKQFIVNLQGKDFILFAGLLNEFHINGGNEITTAIISTDPFIVQATVKGERGIFQGIGDADESNVNKMIAKHKFRMAETRSICRALRWYNNIGMCSADELGGDDSRPVIKPVPVKTKAAADTFGKDVPISNKCSSCNCDIPDVVKDFSIKHYGSTLCRACQTKNQKRTQ